METAAVRTRMPGGVGGTAVMNRLPTRLAKNYEYETEPRRGDIIGAKLFFCHRKVAKCLNAYRNKFNEVTSQRQLSQIIQRFVPRRSARHLS